MSDINDPSSYERLASDLYVYGSVALALAMASETDMVDTLCTATTPLTSTQIATQRKLKERYVREVLNSLTAIGLVQLKTGGGGEEGKTQKEEGEEGKVEGGEVRYWVPPNCRQILKTYGAFNQFVSACARNFSTVRQCLDLNGPNGCRYGAEGFDAMDRVGQLMVDAFVDAILKTPGLKEQLDQGIQVLEVGGGTGWLSIKLASQFPQSHFTLTDPSPSPLHSARRRADLQGLSNMTFTVMDVFDPPADLPAGSFDWLVCVEVIHDLPYPLKALQQIHAFLRPGGKFSLVDQMVGDSLQDNLTKDSAALYAQSTFLCVPESFQKAGAAALGACWGRGTAVRLVREAGMEVEGVTTSDDLGTMGVCMCRKPE